MYCGEDIIYSIHNNTIFLSNFSDAYKYAKHYVSDNYQSGVIGEIWAIGGSLIYEKAIELNLINQIYVTYVNETYKCDTFLSDRTITFLNKHKNKIKELVKSYHIGYDEHEYCIYVY
jgi:dihydrofolate reductase